MSLYRMQLLTPMLQVAVPGFEFSDHSMVPAETLSDLLSNHQAEELRWLLA